MKKLVLFIMMLKRESKIILYLLLLFSGLLIKEYAAVFVNPFLQPQQKRLYMVRSGNLRESNDINSPIITVLDSGTVVLGIEKDRVENWFHVSLEDGTVGWIYYSLLRLYEDDYREKGGSEEIVVKVDEESEMKSEEVKEEDYKVELEENTNLPLDRKPLSESVPPIIENPVNKYLWISVSFLMLTNVSLILLFYKSTKKYRSILIKSKVIELENYMKKNEKLNEKVSFFEKKINQLERETEEKGIQVVEGEKSEAETFDSESKIPEQKEELYGEIKGPLNLHKIYMHQFVRKIRESYS